MRPAARFVLPTVALCLLVAVAVWAAWLQPERADPCAHPDVLEVTGLIPGSKPRGQRKEKLGGDVIQWSEGSVADPDRPRSPLEFRIVRSYSALKKAEQPLALLREGLEPEILRSEVVEAAGTSLPIHIVRTSGNSGSFAVAYLFLLGNEPVAHPLPRQVTGAGGDLLRGARPLTVLLAGGLAHPDDVEQRERLARDWVVAAWEHYRAMCFSKRGPSAGGAAQAR